MRRIRIILPKKADIHYKYLDILHDAIVNAWIAAGAQKEQILDMSALPWNFAALGGHNKQGNKKVHTLVISTPDASLAKILRHLNPEEIRYARASTIENVNFADAQISIEDDPIMPNQNALGVLMLSPLAISDKTVTKGKRWHKDLSKVDLSAAINHRLSRFAGRDIKLVVQVDSLYLRCNPEHSVLVPTKLMRNSKKVFVIGMSAPLVLAGSEHDLRFAWYAGLGEKNRNGFGCIGLAEQGVGR
ncbi:CRISPR-associated protein Cas6 [Candidatus Thiomargarita nelsonii]|uniref:CRISPR-associated protein Cas6 n=1 Tax=Candidatus Thiomargarita nelsonii TaxID=1003181 RepID=A0A4E0RC91_9GAMM|nr:CRISPR-associated protein Cas6 [Candidatus Thiomargarita nelsonii]